MSWLRRYRLRLYTRNSMWVLPALSIVAGLFAVRLLTWFDRLIGWQLNISADTARLVIVTVAGSLLTLVVVVSSAMLVAVQLASAQLTPRVITLVYQNTFRKFSLALFVFTFTLSVAVIARIEDRAPAMTSLIATYGFVVCLGLFLYYIDDLGKSLRPSAALRVVGMHEREVLRSVYPKKLEDTDLTQMEPLEILESEPHRVVHTTEDGAVLAVDLRGLLAMAEQSDCLIEIVPQVGDFVAHGDPLFRLFYGGDDLSEENLRNSVAVGQERTMEQDPTFAFRIIVDIAIKGLSPAINDPTTAVLAIDQLHHLLRYTGSRFLAEGRERDAAGRVRLSYRTPNWEDFVSLAVTEIRHFGCTSIQITRRLHAMLENLIETLPKRRHAALEQELRLLHSTVERSFAEPGDRIRAGVADLQGVGGRTDEVVMQPLADITDGQIKAKTMATN